MNIKKEQRRKTTGRWKRTGLRGKTAGFFIGVILCSMFSGLAGTACAAEGHAEAQAAAATEQKQAEKEKVPEPAETVVARVNGTAITKRSLDLMAGKVQLEPASRETGDPGQTHAGGPRDKALNRLILQELVYQKAKKEGFNIAEKDLEATISDIKEKAGGEEAYRTYLKGISRTEDELRATVERSLVTEGFYKREISDKIIISEEMLKAEYERNRDKFVIPEVMTVTDVVFFLDTGDKASLKRAKEIRAKIASAPNKDPWALESDGTFAVRELAIKKDKDADLYREVMKLKEGDLSKVINTNDSFHVVQLKKYVPETKVPFEQVRPFLDRKLRSSAQQEMTRKWEQELKEGAVIEIMTQGNE